VVEVSEGRGEDQRKRSEAGSEWSGVDDEDWHARTTYDM
jgi:hypothetical protein